MSGRWPARRLAIALGLLVLWVSGGVGTYAFLAAHRSGVARRAAHPGESGASVNPALARLPGTLYLVQDGALYRLQRGRFTAVLRAGGWTQPAVLPSGQALLVVKRDGSGFSDLYRVDGNGQAEQLTHNQGQGAVAGRDPGGQVVTQYWAMYPRASPDGTQVYFATDRYKHLRCCPFDVTLRLAQMPMAGGTPRYWTVDAVTQTVTHTEDGDYAGGDAQPVPLTSGGLLFVRFSYSGNNVGSQLMLLRQARATPLPLTAVDDRCSQPALSPDGSRVALVCTYANQSTSLEVAAFDGSSLGPRQVIPTGGQVAQPAWSPDGSRLVYMAPVGMTGHFQLWSTATPASLPAPPRPAAATRARTQPTPPPPTPATAPPAPASVPAPVQLTDNLDFDATSPIAWAGA